MTEMNNKLLEIIQSVGIGLDIIGVLVVLIGFIVASIVAFRKLLRKKSITDDKGHVLYKQYRQDLARAILIGLEFLVAGDLIRTVGGSLTPVGVATLGGIVLIRVVLGATLQSELDPDKKPFWTRRSK